MTQRFGFAKVTAHTVLTAPPGTQLNIHSIAAINGSVTNGAIGLGLTVTANNATVYSLIAGSASAYNGTAFTTTIGDGFLVQSKNMPVDMLAFNVSQRDTGAATYTYEYWNGASFVFFTPNKTPTFTQLGETGLVYASMYDWAVGNGGIAGLSNAQYTLRVRSTVAPSQAVITSIQPVKLIVYREVVESKQSIDLSFDQDQYLFDSGESVIPYFEVADPQNSLEISWQNNP